MITGAGAALVLETHILGSGLEIRSLALDTPSTDMALVIRMVMEDLALADLALADFMAIPITDTAAFTAGPIMADTMATAISHLTEDAGATTIETPWQVLPLGADPILVGPAGVLRADTEPTVDDLTSIEVRRPEVQADIERGLQREGPWAWMPRPETDPTVPAGAPGRYLDTTAVPGLTNPIEAAPQGPVPIEGAAATGPVPPEVLIGVVLPEQTSPIEVVHREPQITEVLVAVVPQGVVVTEVLVAIVPGALVAIEVLVAVVPGARAVIEVRADLLHDPQA